MQHIGNDMHEKEVVDVGMSELTKVVTSPAIQPSLPAIGQAAGMDGTSASQSSSPESYNITGGFRDTVFSA